MQQGGIVFKMGEINNFTKIMMDAIKKAINNLKIFDLYIITNINKDENNNYIYSANIKHQVKQNVEYKNVPIMGFNLGNFKGVMCFPEVNDFVLVGFLDERTPIILGTLFNQNDTAPKISPGNILLCGKEKGNYIFIDDDKIKLSADTIQLGGNTAAVARVGDEIEVVVSGTTYTGTITTGSSKVKSG